MKIYNYHPEYKHFISEGLADPSPLEPGVWLIPAHATEIEPPEFSEGFIPVFNGTSWEIIEDKTGIYYSINLVNVIYSHNPFEAPEGYTKEEPPAEIPEGKDLIWDNGWIFEDIPSPPELTAAEKLEKSGITIDELKDLLGLNT